MKTLLLGIKIHQDREEERNAVSPDEMITQRILVTHVSGDPFSFKTETRSFADNCLQLIYHRQRFAFWSNFFKNF
jgi:hypothetical protein